MESKDTLTNILTPEKSEIAKEMSKQPLVKAVKKNIEMRSKLAEILKTKADEETLAYFAKSIDRALASK